jgi:arylsulfatase
MVCDGRYKLTKVHGCTQGAEGELYDLQEKPLERYNYYNNPAFTEIKVRMLELLADRMAQTCDPLPTRKACW